MKTVNGIEVTKITLRNRKNGHGEFEVRFHNAYGRVEPELTYFSTEWIDAVCTARYERDRLNVPFLLSGKRDDHPVYE